MKFLPYARLMRLPNVFTAFADVLMASSAVLGLTEFQDWQETALRTALLCIATGSLYISGMIWNDYFDLEIDRIERPFRPLPSGQISIRFAFYSAVIFMVVGLAISMGIVLREGADPIHLLWPVALAAAILFYDGIGKGYRTSPIWMALCRFINIVMVFEILLNTLDPTDPSMPYAMRRPEAYKAMLTLGLMVAAYIAAVTLAAKSEAGVSNRVTLFVAKQMLNGIIAYSPFLLYFCTSGSRYHYATFLLQAALYMGIYIPYSRAAHDLRPANVQTAIKWSILGLIVFDAILATTFVGWPGLLIALLLIPALVLGKWVYST